jgi:DNA-binding beta-propeller fold protein YncE
VAVKVSFAVALLLVAALGGCSSGGRSQPLPAADRSSAAPVPVATKTGTVVVANEAVAMAYDGRFLWVGSAAGGAVTQVDPAISQVIRTIKLPGRPSGVAVTAEGVWVADNAGAAVYLLDPGSGRVNAKVRVGNNPLGFAQVGRELWVFSQSDQRASVLDPKTATVVRTVDLPGLGAGYPSVAAGAIWVPDVAGTTRSVWRVDPVAGQATRRLPTAAHPAEVVFGFGSGWATDEDGVTRFDPATGKEQTRVIGVGRKLDGVAVTADAVWAVSIADNTLSRIDPATNRTVGSIDVCTGPRHLTVVGDDIWVACYDSGILVRVHPS